MAILVVNPGSTTIKFKLFNSELHELLGGVIDHKDGKVVFSLNKNNQKYEWEISEADFKYKAPELILKECAGHEISKIGYRVVHGGEHFTKPTVLDNDVIFELEKISNLAPLHNPPALNVIRGFRKLKPDTDHIAVFDTAFHASMPAKAYRYAIPANFYNNQKIRRYGFHGTSHKYIRNRLAQLEPAATKIISCHLGGGASISAILNGTSVDNSMGFTPLEGLIMATRSGDLDNGAVLFMIEEAGVAPSVIREILNKQSGLLALSENTSDMRVLLKLSAENEPKAKLAIESYIYHIQKYIGAYAAAMNGVDCIAFTAGVGYGSDVIRNQIIDGLSYLGFSIDPAKNNNPGHLSEFEISSETSKPIWTIAANEELAIAQEI